MKMCLWQTAMMLGDIQLNDKTYNADSWSRISGIPKAQIVKCKHDFLKLINYDLSVDLYEFDRFVYSMELVARHDLME
jgi:hypothetical protein